MPPGLLLLTALAGGAAHVPAWTVQDGQIRSYDLPAGPLEAGLRRLADRSGEQVLFDPRQTAGRSAGPLAGPMTTGTALSRLLAGSGLTARRTARGVWVIDAAPAATAPAEVEPVELEEVIVTGVLAPGRRAPAALAVLGREDLRARAGVGDALQGLLQTFGGSGNEAALQTGADPSGVNVGFGTGVNLRGLGSDATLVLVNGRRLAGAGAKADFTDVSLIPAIAVDRIEVLLDGASAIYGSDAVAGVVNVILKTDHQGRETDLRAGAVMEGSMQSWGLGHLAGRRWSTGGLVLAYEQQHRDPLPVAERPPAGAADLRPLGGRDRRVIYSDPGNLVEPDPRSGVLVSTHAIRFDPDGSIGFAAGERNLGDPRAGLNVLGRQDRRSVFAALRETPAPGLKVTAQLLFGRRTWRTIAPHDATVFSIDARNPGFTSPTGASAHLVAYDFGGALGSPRLTGDAGAVAASGEAELSLGAWRLRADLSHARSRTRGHTTGQLNTAHLKEALGTVPDHVGTRFSVGEDGYFNPFAPSQPPGVRAFLSEGWTRSAHDASVSSLRLQLEGPPVALPAGDVRLAAGMDLRRETQAERAEAFTSTFAPTLVVNRGGRDTAALFAGLDMPVWRSRPGASSGPGLDLSLAVRHEDHDGAAPSTTHRIGLRWTSGSGVAARAAYGTSFRAPALSDLHDAPLVAPSLLPRGDGATPTLVRYGGNTALEPETAASLTAGVEWSPPQAAGTRLALNWFETRLERQIGRPAFDRILGALLDPALRPFVEFVSPATNPADRMRLQALLNDPATVGGEQFPVEAYGAIVDTRYRNTGALAVEGVDLEVRHEIRLGRGVLRLSGAATRLLRYEVQATPAGPRLNRLDRPNFPLAMRGRFGLEWSERSWDAGLTLHYAGGYRDFEGRRIAAWSTADLRLSRRFSGFGSEPLTGSITLENLFGADPPFYDAPEGLAYDAANADVLGRRLSIQLTRVW